MSLKAVRAFAIFQGARKKRFGEFDAWLFPVQTARRRMTFLSKRSFLRDMAVTSLIHQAFANDIGIAYKIGNLKHCFYVPVILAIAFESGNAKEKKALVFYGLGDTRDGGSPSPSKIWPVFDLVKNAVSQYELVIPDFGEPYRDEIIKALPTNVFVAFSIAEEKWLFSKSGPTFHNARGKIMDAAARIISLLEAPQEYLKSTAIDVLGTI